MTPEKEDKLFKDFDHLYRGRKMPISVNLMSFGFSVGDGWFDLIYNLSAQLQKLSPDTLVFQVKEKFGGLRFYVDECTEKGFTLIHRAEGKSFTQCETCGKPGSPQGPGWIRTLCLFHYTERQEK